MANAKKLLTRDAYAVLATDTTVSVQLPTPPYREGFADQVELIAATTIPTVPSPESAPHEDGVILENTRYGITTVTNWTVPSSETLYGRWLGTKELADANDLIRHNILVPCLGYLI